MMNLINETLANLTWFNLFILTIGAYSLTRLVVTDSIFDGIRERFFKQFPHDGYASKGKPARGQARRLSNDVWAVDKGTFLGNLIQCPWCAGFWVSLAVFGAFVLIPEITVFALLPFAMRVLVGGYANKIGGG